MGVRILSHDTLLAERAAAREARRAARGPARVVDAGTGLPVPIQRLITSGDGLAAFADTVRIDVNEGRENVPLLYEPLYRRLAADNLPRTIDLNLIAQAAVVFLQRFEGGEVHFGHMAPNTPASVSLANYSAGFEYTSEMVEFDETWSVAELNRAFGEAYNALLNHLHLGPFLSYTYTADNQTPADATAGASSVELMRNTLIAAYRTSVTAKRPGSVLLASSTDRFRIEDALQLTNDSNGNRLPPIGVIDTVIYYDGFTIDVGPKTYSYPGVTAGTGYLIQPQRRLREIVKTRGGQDMFIETGNPDVSRRIEDQITAHTYRTLYSDVAGSTEEITLP